MGSRRLGWAGGGGGGWGGCPLPEPATPIPAASIALTLGELLNLLAAVFSFFLFCYTEKKKKRRGMGVKKGAKWKTKKIIKDKKKWRKKGVQGSIVRNSTSSTRQEESSVLTYI